MVYSAVSIMVSECDKKGNRLERQLSLTVGTKLKSITTVGRLCVFRVQAGVHDKKYFLLERDFVASFISDKPNIHVFWLTNDKVFANTRSVPLFESLKKLGISSVIKMIWFSPGYPGGIDLNQILIQAQKRQANVVVVEYISRPSIQLQQYVGLFSTKSANVMLCGSDWDRVPSLASKYPRFNVADKPQKIANMMKKLF